MFDSDCSWMVVLNTINSSLLILALIAKQSLLFSNALCCLQTENYLQVKCIVVSY